MEPQINTIFSRLGKAKTELKSERLELGLIDDLNKALENSEQVIDRLKEGNALIKRDEKFLEKDSKEIEKRLTIRSKASDVYFKLEDQFLRAKQKLEEAQDGVKSYEKRIDELEARLESYKKSKLPVIKKAQNLIAVFEKNIKKAEAAAKDLGLKLPIAKYTKAQDNLRKNL